jgi:hypothetical protein
LQIRRLPLPIDFANPLPAPFSSFCLTNDQVSLPVYNSLSRSPSLFDTPQWRVDSAEENMTMLKGPDGGLHAC